MTPLQQMIAQIAKDAVVLAVVMEASSHSYHCRCEKCLQWWVACGPEDTNKGWSFGPFTEAEFVAAGGTVPPWMPAEDE